MNDREANITTSAPYEGPTSSTEVFVHDSQDKLGFAIPALLSFLLLLSTLITTIGLILLVVVTQEVYKKTIFNVLLDHLWVYILTSVFSIALFGIAFMATFWTAQRRFQHILLQIIMQILLVAAVAYFVTSTIVLVKDDLYWSSFMGTCKHVEPFHGLTFCSEIHAALKLLVAGSIFSLICSVCLRNFKVL